jgi:hypothetical protein
MVFSDRGVALGRCDPTVVAKARLIRARDLRSGPPGAVGEAAGNGTKAGINEKPRLVHEAGLTAIPIQLVIPYSGLPPLVCPVSESGRFIWHTSISHIQRNAALASSGVITCP